MASDGGKVFDWEIEPYARLGPLRFGQTRSELRSLLGDPSKSFKKVPFAETETDAYNDLGLHLYYDPNDRLESIDAWGPSIIHIAQIRLLNLPADRIVKELEARGYTNHDYFFERGGFSLYVIEQTVNGVTVFCRNYYDTSDPQSAINRVSRGPKGVRTIY